MFLVELESDKETRSWSSLKCFFTSSFNWISFSKKWQNHDMMWYENRPSMWIWERWEFTFRAVAMTVAQQTPMLLFVLRKKRLRFLKKELKQRLETQIHLFNVRIGTNYRRNRNNSFEWKTVGMIKKSKNNCGSE